VVVLIVVGAMAMWLQRLIWRSGSRATSSAS
jgi:hypothetical protein